MVCTYLLDQYIGEDTNFRRKVIFTLFDVNVSTFHIYPQNIIYRREMNRISLKTRIMEAKRWNHLEVMKVRTQYFNQQDWCLIMGKMMSNDDAG